MVSPTSFFLASKCVECSYVGPVIFTSQVIGAQHLSLDRKQIQHVPSMSLVNFTGLATL